MVGKSSQRSSPPKAYHHGDLRRALLDATLQLIEAHGPQGFTLRAAARAVGVTPGATYHHFAHKEALIAAVAEEGFAMLRAVLEGAAGEACAGPEERSRNVGVAYVRFAVEHPTRFRIMVGIGVKQQPAAVAATTFKLVRDILIDGLRVTPAEVIAAPEVLGWWAVVHGLAFLAIDGHLGAAARSIRQTEALVRQALLALEERGARRLQAGLAATVPAGDATGATPSRGRRSPR